MNFKKQVLRNKARHLKKRIVTEALLHYVKFVPSVRQVTPDFLGIGSARSATGWLHNRLCLHPDIFLPSQKEVHFFDKISEGDSKYFFDLSNPIHWRWYHYQFKDCFSKVKGEITPAYSILDEERIKEISSYLPNVKLIYCIRNPIDRAWSSLRYRLWYGKGITAKELSVDELKRIIQLPEIITKSCHRQNIQRWEGYFPKENFFYIFYDDIKKEPGNVLTEVCKFLSVDPNALLDGSNHERRVNTVPNCSAPREIIDLLKDIFSEQIDYVERKFNRDLPNWHDIK